MSWASPPRGSTTPTRRAASSHQPWEPLPYMRRGVEHLKTHRSAGLPLKPGGRKTSITLTAFSELRDAGTVQTMLVIAPLRVCRQVWRQEGAKWTHLRHLKFALLHGPKKEQELKSGADIYLINPEGVAWLCKQYVGRQLPFDVVCIDELTKFKNHSADRSKALRPRIERTAWKWGLTGSLAPNGYMDLFGQQLILDGGAALGRYITHYQQQYFQVAFNGFDYALLPGADKRIAAKLAPYWMHVDENDYSQLPPLVPNPIMLDFDRPSRALYDKMKKEMLAELPAGLVTAANQAACYSKLSQMANGAVYVGDHKDSVAHIHDMKLDAVEDLLEELNGEPLLVGYEFNHDLERLRNRFGTLDPKTGKKVLPYLGKGTSAAQEDQWIAAWNRGELPLLCAHPASAGHGLNMQEGSAANVCWFGITWDFELYDQFIRRIWRSGTQAGQIFNHLLIVRGTIDELKLEALGDKDMTQTRLLRALNTQILRDAAETQGAGDIALDDRRLPMVQRLSRQDGGAPAVQQGPQGGSAPGAPVQPRGWGKPAGGAQTDVEEHTQGQGHPDQRERIQDKIAPTPAEQARSAFSGAVGQATAAVQEGDYGDVASNRQDIVHPSDDGRPPPAEAPATTRSRSHVKPPKDEPAAVETPPFPDTSAAIEYAALMNARARVLHGVICSDPNVSVEDAIATARDLMEFVTRG